MEDLRGRHATARLGVDRPAVARGALMLVVDASVAVRAVDAPGGFAVLGDDDLVGPALMWSEARSALRAATWRRDISFERGLRMVERLESAPVRRVEHADLGPTWRIADRFGWAKACDAEYVALARLLDCRLVTLDERLRGGTVRLGMVVTPSEL